MILCIWEYESIVALTHEKSHYNEDFSSRFVYTIELTESGEYWICGWSENNTYLIFDGKLTDDVNDEFLQVKKLFLLNSHKISVQISNT